jgi:hypothetical protein
MVSSRKFLRALLASLLALSFSTSSLASNPQSKNLRIQITRPITKKLKEKLKKERARGAKKARAAYEKRKKTLKRYCRSMTFSPLSPLSLLETSLHSISGIFEKECYIEIENGAGFSMSSSDMTIASTWPLNAILKITPNHSWFSSYDYCITNEQTKEYVKASLTRGPLEKSPYNKRIVDINTNSGLILLDNGSYFQVSESVAEKEAISQWEIGDVIIVGDNDSWFSFGCQNILINSQTAHYVTAYHIE